MIKIQLDGKALERMIGGDTDAELEIRNGIVQEFARKHLKPVLAVKIFQEFLEKESIAIRAYSEKLMDDHITEWKSGGAWNRSSLELKSEVKAKIEAQARLSISSQISKIMEDEVKKGMEVLEQKIQYMKEKMERVVDQRLAEVEKEVLTTKIQNHMQKLVGTIKI